jgi:hypothetical protein
VGPRDGGRKPGGGQRPGWGGEERAGGGCSVKCRREGDAEEYARRDQLWTNARGHRQRRVSGVGSFVVFRCGDHAKRIRIAQGP